MLSTLLAIMILNNQPQPKPIITPGNNIARKCSRPGGGRACEPRLVSQFVPECPKEGCQNPVITEGSGTRKSLGKSLG